MPVYKDTRRGWFFKINRNGKQYHSKYYDLRKDAEKAMAKMLLDDDVLPSEMLTFNQVADIFLKEKETRLKRQSFDRLRVMLGHFLATLGNVRVDKLTVNQYSKALHHLDEYRFQGRPLKNSYKNKVVRTFNQLCAFADRRFDLRTTVPQKFDKYRNEDSKEMKFITLDQFRQLLDVVDDPMFRALFVTLYFCGLRIGEANALQWKDVDFEKRTLSVNKTVTTKVSSEDGHFLITSPKTKSSIRTLPLPGVVCAAFNAYREQLVAEIKNAPDAFIFGGVAPIPESTIQRRKNVYFKKAGLDPIRLHDFRHSCASFLVNNGASPLIVSKFLGHSDVAMTLNIYSHLWPSELDGLIAVIDEKIQ